MAAPIALIVARAENGVIGAGGGLPWHLPGDLKHFKELTLGKPCIMGRKTWESLPKKPLPGRSNIVITRNPAYQAEGARVVESLAAAITFAEAENPSEIMIIGGADIFAAALPLATAVYLTEVHGAPEGDVVMPGFDPALWAEGTREMPAPSHSYVLLQRRGALV
ncbi:dihydrofolate reductase [Rhizomicrobium palustre]|uniref:Dihydrofolate reductase n=1 Tax=Rhizomicrobium palustre TaxID=189966 RepID=A0A846MVR3_9PROT|nr:dihydrofolate reductase [Rhizomicrobium palustre]NIK87466.1 dihydrofolate reductase [Rhizomicrobium palustre]